MSLKYTQQKSDRLAGARVLVAEDEFLIGLDIAAILADAGAEVLGPYSTLQKALSVAEQETLTAASLDVRLGSATTERIADVLFDRGIPFAFYTGNELPGRMRSKWPSQTVLAKPADEEALVTMVSLLIKQKTRFL